jgi:hypothetical protein
MEISLLHAGLAAGATLAVVPLILHLLMRQTPRHVIFPALRLIRERQKQSKKRLRVKNWLLLLARMALFALMALALARPTITTEASLGGEEVDTAIALVIDTSQSMEYTERGNNRLKEATLRAAEILKKATDRSEVYVINSAEPTRPAAVSPALAQKQVEAMTLRDSNRPLNASVVQAYAAVAQSTLPRRDVYILTDLARSAWDTSSSAVAEAVNKANLVKEKKVNCYVLRLTPKEAKDVAIVSAEPASTIASEGERMEIRAKLRSSGEKESRVAELRIDNVLKDNKKIEIPQNGEVELSLFTPNSLSPGLHQGEVRLSGGTDFMPFDDVRYFSFSVQPPQRVLLVSEAPIDALYVQKVLEPDARDLPEGTAEIVKVERISTEEFARKDKSGLKSYAAVFLLNVPGLSEADWGALNRYVREGGGLVVGLGNRIQANSYNGPIASQLLPAKIGEQKAMPPNTFFAKPDANHSLFNKFARELDAELLRVVINRAWTVTPQGGRTILSYTDNSPALLERTFQGVRTGHVLLWTTPLSRGIYGDATIGWNEFPGSWSFLVMLDTVNYLSGQSGERLNYEAGEDAILTIDPARRSANYRVRGPNPEETETPSVTPNSDKLVIPSPQSRGQWRVEGKAADGSPVIMGFSVNVPEGESSLTPLEEKDLFAIFGSKDNVNLADDASSLKRIVEKIHVGVEIFPWLMFLILIIVTLENLLANRFHRERATA